MNFEAPEKQKNLRSTQFDWQFISPFDLHFLKILRCSISLKAISDPCYFSFCPMLHLSLCWSAALFFLSLHIKQIPALFQLLWFPINTPLICWDSIIVLKWLKVKGCFTWGLLTISAKCHPDLKIGHEIQSSSVQNWSTCRGHQAGLESTPAFGWESHSQQHCLAHLSQ